MELFLKKYCTGLKVVSNSKIPWLVNSGHIFILYIATFQVKQNCFQYGWNIFLTTFFGLVFCILLVEIMRDLLKYMQNHAEIIINIEKIMQINYVCFWANIIANVILLRFSCMTTKIRLHDYNKIYMAYIFLIWTTIIKLFSSCNIELAIR